MKNLAIYVVLMLAFLSCSKTQDQKIANAVVPMSSSSLATITNTKMVEIPNGSYRPFFGSDTVITKIAAFLLDEHPVTNQQFLAFVTANPEWRKSNIKSLYADTSYLTSWKSDLEIPTHGGPNSPITNVSWFAARAYAHSVGKRLPTLDEWEFVAMADAISPNARKKKEYSSNIVDLYLQKDRQYNNIMGSAPNFYGIYNTFDLVWEWTEDFNSVLTTGDSRNDNKDEIGLFCGGGAASASDLLNYAAFMRFGLRTSLKANYTVANLGFRCAKDLKQK